MYTRLIKHLNLQSYFLFGPRGVGKTQWLESQFQNANYIDLLYARTFNQLSADPSRLSEMLLKPDEWVIIDEIQKLPALLDEVHRLIQKKGLRFVLTGSSARKLKKQSANLLAGRALTRYMFPLTAEELSHDFEIEKSLKIGHLPMAYTSQNPDDYLQSYVQTHVKEELTSEGLIRNLMGFSRFLEAASFSQCQYLNITKVAADSMVDRKVTEEYFKILEDLLLSVRLPAFQKRAARKIKKHPKFYFIDCGIWRAIRPNGPLDRIEEVDGFALETLIFQDCRATNEYQKLGYQFFSWSLNSNTDVDFVMYGKSGLLALEVKRTNRLRGGELDGLKAFKQMYPTAKVFFIYQGEERIIDGISILPAEKFLKNKFQYLTSDKTPPKV